MPVNWKSVETYERLFVALLASIDNKINITEVVRIYGEGMTRDALENRLRVLKKDATAMKAKADGDPTPPSTPAKPRKKKSDAPSTPSSAVKTGRVTKKKATPSKIKAEALDDEDDESFKHPATRTGPAGVDMDEDDDDLL